MKKRYLKYLLLAICLGIFAKRCRSTKEKENYKRASTKRAIPVKQRSQKPKQKLTLRTAQIDTVAVAAAAPLQLLPFNDSLPINMY